MAYSDTGKRPVKYRKTISPELTAGTAFDGVQPGDLVKVHLKGSKTVLSPVFIIDVQETPGGGLTAIVAVRGDGVKKLDVDDVLSMKLTGDQKSPALSELRRLQGEWLKTRKSLQTVAKQIAPLVAAQSRLKLTFKSVTDGFEDKLSRL